MESANTTFLITQTFVGDFGPLLDLSYLYNHNLCINYVQALGDYIHFGQQ